MDHPILSTPVSQIQGILSDAARAIRPKRRFKDRLPQGDNPRFIDRTGPQFEPHRRAVLAQIQADAEYEAWVSRREMIGALAQSMAGPGAHIPEPPPE